MEEKIEFSEEDKRMNIKIPEIDNTLLAYETGVHIGDGSLHITPKKTHSVRYFGHKEDDWIFYSEIIPRIIKELYNKDVRPTKRNDANTCTLNVCSRAITTFKHKIIGLPVGKKEQIKSLPEFVKKSKDLLINCIKGIADTDFSLYFNKNWKGNYSDPQISCTMSNRNLIEELSEHLQELGFRVNTRFDVKRERNGKTNTEHRLGISGKENLLKWMKLIGFNNPHHLSKFLVWKKFGTCQPKTTLNQRLKLLGTSSLTQYVDPVDGVRNNYTKFNSQRVVSISNEQKVIATN